MEREETVCKECQSKEVEDVVMPCMEFTGGGGALVEEVTQCERSEDRVPRSKQHGFVFSTTYTNHLIRNNLALWSGNTLYTILIFVLS